MKQPILFRIILNIRRLKVLKISFFQKNLVIMRKWGKKFFESKGENLS
ncbi:hypothetical protein AF60_02320 [Streptococcus uberis S6261]|nr:hypothetical protein AF64_08965 [Streptococcus uberis C9359]KKF47044.1 hypothetical protein AF60_02320 [Streptococcus uberis S6261]KKF51881.1 hypothetical protein AF65_09025 [Streptococcus uberis C5388]